jgi:hypothetical protein
VIGCREGFGCFRGCRGQWDLSGSLSGHIDLFVAGVTSGL